MRKLTGAAALATAAPFVLACPAPAHAQVLDKAGRPLSPEEARRLDIKISQLQKTTGLQAATIAGIASRLNLAYAGLSEQELFKRLDSQVNEAAGLRDKIGTLEKQISILEDRVLADKAQGYLENATLAFEQGQFQLAEEQLSNLAILRQSDSEDAYAAWLNASESQAKAAELQGSPADFERADEIRLVTITALRERQRQMGYQIALNQYVRASARLRRSFTFGGSALIDEAILILEDEVLPAFAEPKLQDARGIIFSQLASAYMMRGERASGELANNDLKRAVEVLDQAVAAVSDDKYPSVVWRAYLRLGGTYRRLAEKSLGEKGIEYARKATAAFEKCLQMFDREKDLLKWVQASNDLAGAYLVLSDLDTGNRADHEANGSELLESILAIEADGQVEVDRQLAAINYATFLLVSSRRRDYPNWQERVRRSIDLYDQTLSIFSSENRPVVWATILRNRANAVRYLARRNRTEEARALLPGAIADVRKADEFLESAGIEKEQTNLAGLILDYVRSEDALDRRGWIAEARSIIARIVEMGEPRHSRSELNKAVIALGQLDTIEAQLSAASQRRQLFNSARSHFESVEKILDDQELDEVRAALLLRRAQLDLAEAEFASQPKARKLLEKAEARTESASSYEAEDVEFRLLLAEVRTSIATERARQARAE